MSLRNRSLLLFCCLAAGITLLSPADASAGASGFHAVSGLPSTHLAAGHLLWDVLPDPVVFPPALPAAAGPGRGNLEVSVLGQGDPFCSVETVGGGGTQTCSADTADLPGRCSAQPQTGALCSAFQGRQGAVARCSVLGEGNNGCSIASEPGRTGSASRCSAFGSQPHNAIRCSTDGAGEMQVCSVANPISHTPIRDACSAFVNGSRSLPICSVLQRADKAACSSFRPEGTGSKGRCSAFAALTRCSAFLDGAGEALGRCTAMRYAEAGACSAFAEAAHCSVINGDTGAPGEVCGLR